MTLVKTLSLSLLAVAGSLALSAGAHAQSTKVGTLDCDVSGGIGMIITSQKQMICGFHGASGREEVYAGTITRFGLDIGATTGGQLVWAVFAPSAGWPGPGALAGDYAGATAEATAGVGLGANVLIGGGNRSFALQPLSVQGQTGLNVAAGVANLRLVPARPVR